MDVLHAGGVDEGARAELAGDEPAELAEIVRAWGVGAIVHARRPVRGTINQTVLLTTERGRFVLRGYRHTELEPIAREHASIAHVCARGMPAVAPLPRRGGGAVHERRGRYYSLFPWAPGRQVRRQYVGPAAAAAMGACLARLHVALSDFPAGSVPVSRRPTSFDRPAALERMDEVEGKIRAALATDPLAPTALARLTEQRSYLEQMPDDAPQDTSTPPAQVIHGDFLDANLFFDDEPPTRVTAIVDWDQTALAPRAVEVIRTFELSFDFQAERCRAFLRAYRAAQPLPLAELDAAVRVHDADRRHSVWLLEELYLRGNRRVAQFLQGSGPWVPVSERWARVRDACAE